VKGHPSGDDRYMSIDKTMKRFKYEKDSLLEVLNTAQEVFGFLSQDLLIYISNHLKVPMSQVYGVATFYHMFTFKPKGEHNCIVCKGTACHVVSIIVSCAKEQPAMLKAQMGSLKRYPKNSILPWERQLQTASSA